ncbi:hypothetical protein BC828DRAFT_379890 [Blastocladiella britannica]|nr:hypothetical protein BC828DRAFT_379890 [Blastocladiella britannica]
MSTPSPRRSKPRAPEAAPGFCKRCKSAKATLAARQAVFCQPCFMDGSNDKFRDAMTRLKLPVPRNNDKAEHPRLVAIALSGGTCSRVLVDMLSAAYFAGRDPTNKRPAAFQAAHLVYIDESELIPSADDHLPRLRDMAELHSLPLTVVPLSSVFDDGSSQVLHTRLGTSMAIEAQSADATPQSLLLDLFGTTPSLSAKEDMLATIRHTLLLRAALNLNAAYLALGTSAATLAETVMVATASGRGAAIPTLVAPIATHVLRGTSTHEHVQVIQPLTTFTAKELALHAHFRGLDVAPGATLTSGRAPGLKLSIRHATAALLQTLERGKEGTHATVARTAARLADVSGLPAVPVAAATTHTATRCGMCTIMPTRMAADETEGDAADCGDRNDPNRRTLCRACTATVREMHRKDRRGGTRPDLYLPAFSGIREFLLLSDDE